MFWHTIHIVALGYPNSPTYGHKKAAKEFYESFAFLIPCPVCREHYETHLARMPITPHLDRRDDLFRWTVQLHNEVNTLLGKPRVLESEALSFYRRIGARGTSPVINSEVLDELDTRSVVKGAMLGGATVFALGSILYLVSKS
jgi:Erv1 / Alr family